MIQIDFVCLVKALSIDLIVKVFKSDPQEQRYAPIYLALGLTGNESSKKTLSHFGILSEVLNHLQQSTYALLVLLRLVLV
jgi:hypothetical protein